MPYVDGFVLAVAKKNLKKYRDMARIGARLWMKHGALDYHECVAEDAKPAFGIPFAKIMKAKPGETVIFSWIVFKSRAHRDKVNAAVMKDPAMNAFDPNDMPVDMKRMVYGGFESIVDA